MHVISVGGAGQPNNTVLYQTPQNQTLVYAATPGISNTIPDGVALVNIVTSQPNNYSTSQMGTIPSPATPQYITIPISQLANNPAVSSCLTETFNLYFSERMQQQDNICSVIVTHPVIYSLKGYNDTYVTRFWR